jgi:23S rRNA (uracil747-C5)-methyltransferase
MMLRFVLRSEAKLEQLRAALPWLQAQLPQLKVITANIQPVHMAIMEGRKRFSSPTSRRWRKISTACRCGSARKASFRPTRPWPALYATARDWVRRCRSSYVGSVLRRGRLWPALRHAEMRLTGIEISAEAIACAKQSAAELGLTNLHFQALDSTQFATGQGNVPIWCWSTRRAAASGKRCATI